MKAACDGDLDRVVRVVKLGGFVQAGPDFIDIPKVVNGCSDLMVEVLGDAGRPRPLGGRCLSPAAGLRGRGRRRGGDRLMRVHERPSTEVFGEAWERLFEPAIAPQGAVDPRWRAWKIRWPRSRRPARGAMRSNLMSS